MKERIEPAAPPDPHCQCIPGQSGAVSAFMDRLTIPWQKEKGHFPDKRSVVTAMQCQPFAAPMRVKPACQFCWGQSA